MLIYNSFQNYLEKSIKENFYNNNVDLVIISSDLTSIYQLLNITINKLFKIIFIKNSIYRWQLVVLGRLQREILNMLSIVMFVIR